VEGGGEGSCPPPFWGDDKKTEVTRKKGNFAMQGFGKIFI